MSNTHVNRGRGRARGTFGLVSTRGKSTRPTSLRASHRVDEEVGENRWQEDFGEVEDKEFSTARIADEIETELGIQRFDKGQPRLGWLVNMGPTIVKDPDWQNGRAAINLYFLQEDGSRFKCTVLYNPYFFVKCKPGTEVDVEDWVRREFDNTVWKMSRVEKEDLDLPNHLLGRKTTVIKLEFRNQKDLGNVKRFLLPASIRNKEKKGAQDVYNDQSIMYEEQRFKAINPLDCIEDVREHDVPYYVRCAIDLGYRVGLWYDCIPEQDSDVMIIRPHSDTLKARPEPVVLAFDIETSKSPLKFPDATRDSIMMISYMIDGQGYLITNREIVSQDLEDFEYTPKPEFPGPFTIFNEDSEKEVLQRFFDHIRQARPTIFVTYNGDYFDWPFVEARSKAHGLDMHSLIGVKADNQGQYCCSYGIHMDCFAWVKRDSYLPQGSHGLKAVTSSKLGYNPLELDPEDMTRFAQEEPETLGQYSVSDAVATYYLYMKYVHPFIFSLCNIIPGCGDDVLRKGSGTLCEMLLMVEAFQANVLMPNKFVEKSGKTFEGHLLHAETYVGGHVEALEAGVFRSDIETRFVVERETVQELMDTIDQVLEFYLDHEVKKSKWDIVNYDQVKGAILEALQDLYNVPTRLEKPLIYHLDVAAMYPNIILTNRLQPDALISESTCAGCDYNTPENDCKRPLEWSYRAEYYSARKNEVAMLRNVLETELHPPKADWNGKIPPNAPKRTWQELSKVEQNKILAGRVAEYSAKVHNKKFENKVITRTSIVCQRENDFYINTVRGFRDRRYEYKGEHKKWKNALDDAANKGDAVQVDYCKKMVTLYDSLQLAHKCILNSFYGYVMRKGSRWYSMEMAGIVCLTGARIIQMARQLVEKLGRPLELDTDGIWCILPATFPENFTFKTLDGKSLHFSYPCSMLNQRVHSQFTNHQYQSRNPDTQEWIKTSENSIFFEVDGPYKAMILPASLEEGKLLKKRYAVINHDDTLAELKGFEVKRRGELKLIKIFQSEIFKVFLQGKTTEECYGAVAKVANRWLDVLYSKAQELTDDELFDLISENRSMSKSLEEYGAQKSTSISTAKRLAQFLGDEMVKDKGLNCKFVISQKPIGAPVSERAVPVVIFQAEDSVRREFLAAWLKDPQLCDSDIRDILDWDYYLERFGSVIQKIITIPAAMQKVANPVPRIRHPDWLGKKIAVLQDKNKQQTLESMWQRFAVKEARFADFEIEDPDEDVQCGKITPMDDVEMENAETQLPETQPEVVMQQQPEDDTIPDPTQDYKGWLLASKRKWKRDRQERMRFIQENGPVSRARVGRGVIDGIGGYLARQVSNLVKLPWEVLQIVETDVPGEFKVWALVDGNLHSIPLRVPRTFYINSRTPQSKPDMEWFKMEISRKGLPRSHQVHHLYEITMTEDKYRDAAKKIDNFITHPSIEGAYETQVPLVFRALVRLGCTSSVHATRQRSYIMNGLDSGFQLADLQRGTNLAGPAEKNFASNSWMKDPASHMHFCYIYHISHDHDRGMYGVFNTVNNKVFIIVVDRNDQLPNVAKLWHARFMQHENDMNSQTPFFKYHEDIEVDIKIVATDRDALKRLSKVMNDYKAAKHGPTTVLIQTPRTLKHIVENVVILQEFPHTKIPAQQTSLGALAWQSPATKNMIAQVFNVDFWLKERLNMAKTTDVPFCNIEDDYTMFLSDIMYARRLNRKGMILWYSSSDRPDLGGREMDENYCVVEEVRNPEVNHPGLYTNTTVFLEISRLVLTTLLKSEFINELEGSVGTLDTAPSLGGMAGAGNALVLTRGALTVDQQTPSDHHFQTLKELVLGWAVELFEKKIPFYEQLLDQLLRWLTNPSSKLFDPAMYAYIHSMMKKVFAQLLGELKKLDGTIVYANYNNVVLQTTKKNLETAKSYVDFLTKSVLEKDLFRLLRIEVRGWYDTLLWMDQVNHAGLVMGEDGVMTWFDQWHNRSYLPPLVHQSFDDILAGYVQAIYQTKKRLKDVVMEEEEDDLNLELGPGEGQRTEDLIRALKRKQEPMEDVVDPETKAKRDLIENDIQTRLLETVDWIIHNVDRAQPETPEEERQVKFPELVGSHLVMTNAALEFIKMICRVFSVDSSVEGTVIVVKRNLLRKLQIGDCSEQAMYKDPCETIILPDVMCDYCNHIRDFDLCRDESLMKEWKCDCGQAYRVRTIEEALLDQARKYLLAWQLQDLTCMKCKRVKPDNLTSTCRCGEGFQTRLDREAIVRKFKVYQNLAGQQFMPLLAEFVKWSLGRM